MYYCDQTPQTYYEMVEPHRDQWGLIAQSGPDRDGGDSAHRTGIFYAGLYYMFKDNKVIISKIQKDFEKDLDKLTVGPGQFIRHPDPTKWYSNPGNFSRDQTKSLVVAMGLFDGPKEKKLLSENFQNLKDNYGFYPNRLKNWTNAEKKFPYDFYDVANIGDYAMYVRAMKAEKYKWFLSIGDIQIFAQSLINIVRSYTDPDDTSNDLKMTLILLQAKHQWPTFWSKTGEYLYYKYRNFATPTKEMGTATSGVQSAWNYYFRPENGGPALHKVYQCIIDKELGGVKEKPILEAHN